MTVVSSDSFVLSTPQSRAAKGPLVRVELQPGRYVKMYRADAIEAGHIKPDPAPPGGTKKRTPAEDKAIRPEGDKSVPRPPAPTPLNPPEEGKADDLTVIQGVGQATARALKARGIASFDELRAALEAGRLDFLTTHVRGAIEDYFGTD